MRPVTAREQKLIELGNFATHLRVFVANSNGEWIDLSNLEGRDWVLGYRATEDIDTLVKNCTIELAREFARYNLGPLVEKSKLNRQDGEYIPLLDIGRRVFVEVAIGPVNARPPRAGSTYWIPRFYGEIDTIDWGSDIVTIECRDMGGRLQDTFIQDELDFGSESGSPVEHEMQRILDAVFGPRNVMLVTPVSPGWFVTRWRQTKEPVLMALDKLAKQIGWDVRYSWNNGTGTYELMFTEPPLDKDTIDWEFGPSNYFDITSLSLDRANIRNKIRAIITTADGERITREMKDEDSISRFGERFMEVAEAATSQINTPTEADRMLMSMIKALAYPRATHIVEMPFIPMVELHDIYRFKANNVHYDHDQTLAVVGIEEEISNSRVAMSLTMRGKPAGAYMGWLAREARPGIAPPSRVRGLTPPPSIEAEPVLGGIVVTVPEPLPSEQHLWHQTAVRIKQASGGSVIAVDRGKQTVFVVTSGLKAGTRYWADAAYIDVYGNISAYSSEDDAVAAHADQSVIDPVLWDIIDVTDNIEAVIGAGRDIWDRAEAITEQRTFLTSKLEGAIERAQLAADVKDELDSAATRLANAEAELAQIAQDIANLDPSDTLDRIGTIEATLTVHESEINARVRQVVFDALEQRVTDAEATLEVQSTEIAAKVSQTDFDLLESRVTDAEGTLVVQAGQIAAKVSQTDFDLLKDRVTDTEATLTLQAGQIAARALQTTVDALESRVTTAESNITVLAGQISSKVSQIDFNELEDRVTDAESEITQTASAITSEITRVEGILNSSNPNVWYSSIKQTADEISSVIGTLNSAPNASGQYSAIKQTANMISTVISTLNKAPDATGQYSAITQTLDEINSVVATLSLDPDDPGQYSSIKQTSSSIESIVTNLNKSTLDPSDPQQFSIIKQLATEVSLMVKSDDVITAINLDQSGVKIRADRVQVQPINADEQPISGQAGLITFDQEGITVRGVTGDKSVLSDGRLAFYRSGENTPFYYVRHIEHGLAEAKSNVRFRAPFRAIPLVMVTPIRFRVTHPDINTYGFDNVQVIAGVENISTTGFTPYNKLVASFSGDTSTEFRDAIWNQTSSSFTLYSTSGSKKYTTAGQDVSIMVWTMGISVDSFQAFTGTFRAETKPRTVGTWTEVYRTPVSVPKTDMQHPLLEWNFQALFPPPLFDEYEWRATFSFDNIPRPVSGYFPPKISIYCDYWRWGGDIVLDDDGLVQWIAIEQE